MMSDGGGCGVAPCCVRFHYWRMYSHVLVSKEDKPLLRAHRWRYDARREGVGQDRREGRGVGQDRN